MQLFSLLCLLLEKGISCVLCTLIALVLPLPAVPDGGTGMLTGSELALAPTLAPVLTVPQWVSLMRHLARYIFVNVSRKVARVYPVLCSL